MVISEIASKRLTNTLVQHQKIDPHYFQEYKYCFEITIDFLLYHLILLGIGLLIDRFLLTCIYIISLTPVKLLSGGAHAHHQITCSLISFSMFMIFIFLAPILSLSTCHCILIYSIASSGIIILTPVDHPNKKFAPDKRKKMKILQLLYLTFLIILSVIFYFLDQLVYLNMISLCLTTIFINQLIGLIIYRKDLKNES